MLAGFTDEGVTNMYTEQLNPDSCRTYLVGSEDHIILIDPVLNYLEKYLELLKAKNLTLTHVIDTHTHADHISAGPSLRDASGCEYVMHENAPAQCVSIRVKDGDIMKLDGITIRFLYTPGHTKDSISLIIENQFFTGDFLFLDDAGAGRDDLPGGNPSDHWESLQKLAQLPDSIVVYPAHDYRSRQPSSLGNQKKTNPHLKQRTKEEFIQYLEDLQLGPADWMADVLKANYSCAKSLDGVWIPEDVPACEIKGTMDKTVSQIPVSHISPPELADKLRLEQKPMLIDVRESNELTGDLKALPSVVNIPIGSLASSLPSLDAKKNEEIIVICRSGARATTGAQILLKAGFSNVKVLEGGMLAWKKAFG
ncbi:Hydroxyacylglutathione hydrolase [bioreactor metagenome]|uniref:Hydroxyacylglutathione hydrolase n=1 Tax=bioreactor metagenome TaxID=1076179 RepID=A0A644XH55_9ZZZZ